MKKLPLLLLLVPGLLIADVVYLEGGGKFTGQIVEQTEEKVVVNIGDGMIGVSMDRVEKIEKGPSTLDDFDARASKLGPQDVDGWRNLGLWASSKGLPAQARAAYQRVLALAPDDAEARRALGYVQIDGRWLTEEESYRARGFVKYEGEWMTSSEAQLAQSAAAADQARDDAAKRASDAEFSADIDRMRKEEDAKRAQEERERISQNPTVYWGGFGYGVSTWPATGSGLHTTMNAPAVPPAGVPR